MTACDSFEHAQARPRRVFADMVLDYLPRRPTHAAIQAHMKRAMAIPEGSTGRRCIGRTTACKILFRLAELFANRPVRIAGSTAEFCAELGIYATPATLSAAMRLVCRATPLVRRADYRCWVIDMPVLRALSHTDPRISALEDWTFGAADEASEQTEMPFSDQAEHAEEQCTESPKYRLVEPSLSLRRACAVVRTQHSAADEGFGEPEDPGGLGGASAPPAGDDGAGPASPPASDGDALARAWTKSEWLLAIPRWPQIRRAATLALDYLPPKGFAGTAAELAATLAGFDRLTRASSRTRAQLVRGLESLRKRGLLVVDDGRWFMPEWRANPVLELYGVAEKPSNRAPSAKMLASLEARGVEIEPHTLSHEEAVALNRRLHTRKVQEQPHPRLLAAVVREEAKANLPTDLRATGRLDVAEAREALQRAMEKRSNDEEIGRSEGWWH